MPLLPVPNPFFSDSYLSSTTLTYLTSSTNQTDHRFHRQFALIAYQTPFRFLTLLFEKHTFEISTYILSRAHLCLWLNPSFSMHLHTGWKR